MTGKHKLVHINQTPLRTEGIFARRPITRHQRRALQRLSSAIDAVSDDDRVWFLRHPDRHWRLRPITRSEKDWSEVMGDRDRNYVIVKQVGPGMRERHIICAFLFIDPEDAEDAQIEWLWGECCEREAKS